MEKTFDELIEPLKIGGFEGWYSAEFISIGKAKELLQKVREATIAECHVIADKYYFQNSRNIIRDINDIPTDRIKLTE